MFLILSLLTSAFATCPISSIYSTDTRTDIAVTDLSNIFEQSKGCLTVIEIWASWCGPCVQIAPDLTTIHQKYPTVPILSISADATPSAVEKFWSTYPPVGPRLRFTQWTLATLSEQFTTIGATFPEAIPYFIVLSSEGTLLYETHEPKSLDTLDQLLGQHTAKKDTPQ